MPEIRMTIPMLRRRQCAVGGRVVDLTPYETEVLGVLLAAGGRPVPRLELIEALWENPDREPDTAAKIIHVTVHMLRRLIGKHTILTMRRPGGGVGYAIPAGQRPAAADHSAPLQLAPEIEEMRCA